MVIELRKIKPKYMSEDEVNNSDLYLKESIVFESQENYLIQAGSGFGKTSLLNFIYGINRNFEGEIFYNNKPSNDEIFNYRISEFSYVFQDLKLFEKLTVFENIELKNALTNHKTQQEIYQLLETVGLSTKVNEVVGALSFGQRQRVAIIRALCQPFSTLLLDEPFSHLDQKNSNLILEIIKRELVTNKANLIMTSLDEFNTNIVSIHKVINL